MASIRNRNGKWQARITRKGQQAVAKSFSNKQDAEKWARQLESEMDKGCYTNLVLAERTLFSEVIERYIQQVTLKTRSMREDTYRLKALARHSIAKQSMANLTPMKVAEYRDERLKIVCNGTVIRELSYFSSIINHARREWGININNPIPLVKKPSSTKGRSRILTNEELSKLYEALKPRVKNANHWILPIVKLALVTAMRRGELLALKWTDIDLNKKTAYVPITKNGDSRTVPLSYEAVEILKDLPRSLNGKVFPVSNCTLSAAIERARAKANIDDFHFHDLRHMAITRLAEKLPNLIELSSVTGHRSLTMLKRYYHPRAEDIARKLDKIA